MPQVGGHLIIADKVCEKLGNPPEITKYLPAFRLGAIGPDLTFFLFDPPGTSAVLNEVLEIYRSIHALKVTLGEIASRLAGPVEELADWFTGGVSTEIVNAVGLGRNALVRTFALGLIPGTSPEVPNPFAGLNIPGIPNGPTMTVHAADLSRIFRRFGHPYTSDPGYKDPEPVGNYRNWWWTDVLHYRRTGAFASALLEGAASNHTRAFAKGYATHLAADVCGHAYVNGVVGGPYRNHVYRHMVVENIIDTWLWNHHRGEDLTKARLDQKVRMDGGGFSQIRDLLLRTMTQVYTQHGIVPKHYLNSIPEPGDLDRAYDSLLEFMDLSTNMDLERPVPPPCSFGDVLIEIAGHLQTTLVHIGEQFDHHNSWWEWILAPFLGGAWSLVFLLEVFTLPSEIVLRLGTDDLRWLIYLGELSLYGAICEARWQLALAGWGKPSSEDLTRAYAQACVHLPGPRAGGGGFRCYPQAAVDHQVQGFWLADPGFSPDTVEETLPGRRPSAECCPYPRLADPSVFVDGPSYSTPDDAALRRLADSDTLPETLALERGTCMRSQFGNASDFAVMLLNGQFPFSSFDLDADQGYGFMSWQGPPPAYEPALCSL